MKKEERGIAVQVGGVIVPVTIEQNELPEHDKILLIYGKLMGAVQMVQAKLEKMKKEKPH